ncbi:uncharacterized protein LOC127860707 [Dreissena polymorpha]|uniref:Mitochondria-eating protein C-terminal domain-containing protein n=1 Tax=Dreissena polymorpha TaxID=45954 RepID=A0A9D4S7V1_DREPO|nr:uncharacterized protein LOC127860707 [Dreissena polymorpha]KAH3893805.1 hypothetical protein DPMN_017957 [Dreissena polymorpha]
MALRCFKDGLCNVSGCKRSECLTHEDDVPKYEAMNNSQNAITNQPSVQQHHIITKKAGQTMSQDNGAFEDANDQNSNTQLAARFGKVVNGPWCKLCHHLKETQETKEFELMKDLSGIMKTISHRCAEKAKAVVPIFSVVDEKDHRKRGDTITIEAVVKEVSAHVWKIDHVQTILKENNSDKTENLIRSFIEDTIKVCWEMSISQPPLMLNFEVEGKMYTDIIKHTFTKFSTIKEIESNKTSGTIILVVMPSVVNLSTDGCLKKGEVIVVP